ncbi:MAG: hypothetical protein GC145_02130 [Caulobacter sp.]|nr:hypothetical protein [Caulobacter sp.]
MSLSPMMLVAAICLVMAAAVFGYLAAGRLVKWIGGPREGLALAGLAAMLLGWTAIVATVMLLSGKGALNFVLAGLIPASQVIGLSERLSSARAGYGFLALGLAVCVGLLAVLGWSFTQARQSIFTLGLFAFIAAVIAISAIMTARRIHLSRTGGAA